MLIHEILLEKADLAGLKPVADKLIYWLNTIKSKILPIGLSTLKNKVDIVDIDIGMNRCWWIRN